MSVSIRKGWEGVRIRKGWEGVRYDIPEIGFPLDVGNNVRN